MARNAMRSPIGKLNIPSRLPAHSACAEGIVTLTTIPAVEGDGPQRHAIADREVEHPFEAAAHFAVRDLVQLRVDAARRHAELGLVGDDPDGAGLARGAVQRAL